jgi:glutamate dehydrogenase (NAD(P)+)
MTATDSSEPAFHRVVGQEGTDFYGFVVIDAFVGGRGTGGIRFKEDLTLDEVKRLAREMTWKFAFLHMPSGGAKSGLALPAGLSEDRRRGVCRQFGEAIGDLLREGKYTCGLDMGTGVEDLVAIKAGAGLEYEEDTTGIDSNYYTAVTVLAAAQALLECRDKPVAETTVLIEGLGKVGSNLLELLAKEGARIVGVSTLSGAIYDAGGLDPNKLQELRQAHGDDCVLHYPGLGTLSPEALFTKKADLLVPGGGADSIHPGNVGEIAARFIVPIANISATPEMEIALKERGIDYMPGFVANSGGVFCWRLAHLSPAGREDVIRRGLKNRIKRLIRRADADDRTIAATARDIANANLAAMQQEEAGKPLRRIRSLLDKLSPRRLGYVVGANLLDADWSRQPNLLTRSYFESRYFK